VPLKSNEKRIFPKRDYKYILQFRNLLKIAERSFNNWTEFG
jgi:hypothetical protein